MFFKNKDTKINDFSQIHLFLIQERLKMYLRSKNKR